ncbi:DUF1127 domain-containing protein [Salinarimonas soli]|uniref:DUF1127 domain-containing protein n=1 Tax=Salinarimonas soli TaxID=1638099 RepID=A0A5B2V820_9HYPH|nr:DUF1127 domain-containing protein [Salinarimonas soli]KAA2234582.1 DUF1127 domain-containing protein [Salinarimonas soli]
MQLTTRPAVASENLVFALSRFRRRALEALIAFEERSGRRRQRRALLRLDERTLGDLGLSAADVEREASRDT